MTKGNSEEPTATCTQRQGQALSGLDRIREAARDKTIRFTSLMHHITVDLLRDSFYAIKRDASSGVDNVTWRQYGAELESRLPGLHERVQSGRYRAKPSKRSWLPKPDGRQRPIGIAALEDKIVQQAVVQIFNQIYEVDFLGFSYGFRPGRNPHQGLDAIWVGIMQRKVNWVMDADIRSYFDTIRHGWLVKFLKHRIADPRLLRLIQKWLRAGVSEEGQWSKTEMGTPQGSVIALTALRLFYGGNRAKMRAGRFRHQWFLSLIKYLMHEGDRIRAFSDSRRHPLDTAGPDISDRKHSRQARLKEIGSAAERPMRSD